MKISKMKFSYFLKKIRKKNNRNVRIGMNLLSVSFKSPSISGPLEKCLNMVARGLNKASKITKI
jgi:hypothetical protein